MTDRILIISPNREWREALAEELGLAKIAVLSSNVSARRVGRFLSEDCTAAVIAAEPDLDAAPGGRYAICEALAKQIRDAGRSYPVLLLSVVPDDELAAIALRHPPAATVHDKGLEMDRVAVLRTEWERLRATTQADSTASAVIEIKINAATIGFEARIGQEIIDKRDNDWHGRYYIGLLDEEFQDHDNKPEQFIQEGSWENAIERASKHLWYNLLKTQNGFEEALEKVKSRVAMNFGEIHFRFVVQSDDLEHVPFELVAIDGDQHLRHVAPLARKLLLNPMQMLGDVELARSAAARNGPSVLFISAPASGTFSVGGRTFRGKQDVSLRPLDHLADELAAVIKIHGDDQVSPLDLAKSANPRADMVNALEQGPWDVIHFAGHSIQADQDRHVYLALPNPENHRRPLDYDADDFAQRAAQAQARLVILSSCENCSCRTLFRMASAGVPAVVGYRWPVYDQHAAIFAPMLYEALYARKLSLPRAFQHALFRLKESSGGRITPYSPILLIQPDSWHNYCLRS